MQTHGRHTYKKVSLAERLRYVLPRDGAENTHRFAASEIHATAIGKFY